MSCFSCSSCPVLAGAHGALQDLLAVPRAVGRISLQVMNPDAPLQVAVKVWAPRAPLLVPVSGVENLSASRHVFLHHLKVKWLDHSDG